MSLLPSLAELEAAHAKKLAEDQATRARLAAEKAYAKREEDRWIGYVEAAAADPKKRAVLEENARIAGMGLSAIARGSAEWDRRWYVIRLDWAASMAILGLPYARDDWKPKRPAPEAICGIGFVKRVCRHLFADHGTSLDGACRIEGCGCGGFRW